MPPPVITLTTDFGLLDEYVGVMKGVVLTLCPEARLVDITHQIEPQDVFQAAFTLEAAYAYFPKGAVHVVVVDPGVGSRRKILAAAAGGYFFLAPDNGVLWPALRTCGIDAAVEVTEDAFFRSPVSRTFHGRDVVAPVAAHLVQGTPLSRLGPPMAVERIVRLDFPPVRRERDSFLVGCVTGADRFGNLVTNIRRMDMALLGFPLCPPSCCVTLKNKRIEGISETYKDVDPGNLLALFNSRNFLEVAVSCGSAARFLAAKRGDPVRIRCAKGPSSKCPRKIPPEAESGPRGNRPQRRR